MLGIRFFFIRFEFRFFNFAMNEANCDWLTLTLNMVHLYQNKTKNTLIISALRSQQVQVELEDSINTYGIFRQHFPNIGYWEYVSYANNTMLGNSIEKKVKVISSTLSKSQQLTVRLASTFSSAWSTKFPVSQCCSIKF